MAIGISEGRGLADASSASLFLWISIPLQVPGMRPPFIQIRMDADEAPPQPPKSFLQKYVSPLARSRSRNPPSPEPFPDITRQWIYILLAFLLLNTGGAMEPEEPRQGQGQAAPAGAGAAGAGIGHGHGGRADAGVALM
jgi:hypothetical protein